MERQPISLTGSTPALDLEHRRKGLLWFPYGVGFEGHYRFVNDTAGTGDAEVAFAFPSSRASTTASPSR